MQAAFPWIEQTRALLRQDELGGLLAQLQPATADLARLEGESLTFLPQLNLANRCFARHDHPRRATSASETAR